MARGVVSRLLCAVCLLVALRPSLQRSLQQASQGYRISSKLFSGVGKGGLSLVSNYTLTYDGDGGVTTGALNQSYPGYPLTLTSGELLLSNTFMQASCFRVGLRPASAGIGGFISSYADIVGTTSSEGIFSISSAVILDGSNVSSTGDNTVHSAAADANEQYVFVVYNLGDRSGAIKAQITALTSADCSSSPAPSPSASQVPFVANPPSGSVGQGTGRRLSQFYNGLYGYGSSPAEGPSLTEQASSDPKNAPASGPSASQTESVQISRQDELSDGSLISLGGFTNVSCISYKLMGQLTDNDGELPGLIDVSIFLLNEKDTISWASQGFSLTPDNLDFQAITLQNNNNNGNQFTYIDGLNTSAKYFLWTVTGMQQVDVISSDIILDIAYTGQTSGSCSNNLVSQYAGSLDSYGATSNTVPNAASPGPAPSVAGRQSTGRSSAPGSAPTVAEVAAPEGGIQLQGGGGLFPLPGKKLKLLR